MILYYALTLHQQIACMLHKELYASQEEEAHLYLSNGNNISEEHLENLKGSGFFSEVVIMDDQPTWTIASNGNLRDETVLTEKLMQITELCNKSLIIPIEEYSDIYVMADHFPFGMMLVFNNIPYHYVEEATGVYSTYYLWLDIVHKQKNMLSYIVGEKYGLHGRAKCVIERLIDIDKQFEEIKEEELEGIVDFSIPKLLKKIDHESKEKILRCFGVVEEIFVDDDARNAIIMSEYLAHAKFCTWDEQREIYGRFIDYFCGEMNVFIKPHPNDYQGIYEKWFPQVRQIERDIPAELLPLVIKGDIDLSIALTSTSVYVLNENLDNTYLFRNKDLRSIKLIKHMDLYFVVINMLLEYMDSFSVWGIGADCLQIKYFLRSMGIKDTQVVEIDSTDLPDSENKRLIIFDSLEYANNISEYDVQKLLSNAKDDDVYVFLNTNKDVLFFDEDMKWVRYTVPVSVDINKGTRNSSITEWIYFYVKDDKMRHELLLKEIDKMLITAGIEVKANCDKKEIRERVLEGMLRATEQKCNMLIKRK